MNINELRRVLIRSNRGILSLEGIQIPVQIDNITQRPDEPTEITIHDVTLMSESELAKVIARKQRAYTSYSSYYVGGVSESNVKIEKVIFNDPATIVLWSDGTKTVVKCQDGDIFDPEKGLAMAISKKAMGNKGNYCDHIKKWTEKYYDSNIVFGKVAYTADGSKLTGKLDLNISEKLKKAVESAVDAANNAEATAKANKKKELTTEDAVHDNCETAYQRLLNVLHDKKATKADLGMAIEEAIGYLGAALAD